MGSQSWTGTIVVVDDGSEVYGQRAWRPREGQWKAGDVVKLVSDPYQWVERSEIIHYFTLRGESGTEQYRVLNAQTKAVIDSGVLSKNEKFFDIPAEHSVIVTFDNDGAGRDIWFRSSKSW